MPASQKNLSLTTTMNALIHQEQELTWSGFERLGPVFRLAERALASLNTFIESVDGEYPFAAALMLSIHKASALAFLSIIRKHLAQSQMNLRLVIEYTSLTAYMLAHPDTPVVESAKDSPDKLVWSKKISGDAYRWIAQSFPSQSEFLKDRKDRINNTLSHANIYGSHLTFDWDGTDDGVFQGSFFDVVGIHIEQIYMLDFVHTLISIIHTLTEVTKNHGGFVIQMGSEQTLLKLAKDTDAYAAEHRAKRLVR